MTKNIDDGVLESYFPTSYINYSIPSMAWRSGTIWSRGSCHLLLLKHCIRSKLNINDQTSKQCFPILNTLHITIQRYLMDCKGVYGKVATCYLPPSYLLDFLLLSIAYNTILRLIKYWPMNSASQITFSRLYTKLGYVILIDAPTQHHT